MKDQGKTKKQILSELGELRQRVVALEVELNERKGAEETLREYRRIIEGSEDMIAVVDQDYKYLLVNARFLEYRGLEREEVVGKSVAEVLSKDVFEKEVKKQLDACFKGEAVEYEMKYRYPELGERQLRVSYFPIGDPEGIHRVVSVIRDITEYRRAEETLRESEKRYRSLVETTSDWIWEVDVNGNYIYASSKVQDLLGYAPEEVLGRTPFDFMHEEEARRVRKISAGIAAERRPFSLLENISLHRDGRQIVLETSGVPVFGPDGEFMGYRGMDRDITERKRAEEAIQKSEAKYRRLHESMMDGFVFVSMDGMIKEFNESYREMVGYAPEELLKLTYRDLTPEKWHASEKIVDQQILTRGYSEVYEKEYRKKDGTVFPIELRAFLVKDEIGSNIGMWAIIRDITERKQAETALRRSEERFRELYDYAPVGYHEYDSEGRITSVNRTDLEMLGYTAEEMIGEFMWKFNAEEEAREQVLAKLAGTLPPARNLERTYRRKDGTAFPALCQDRLILDEKGEIKGIRCAIQDITERKWAEQTLQESETRYRTLFESSPLPKWLYNPRNLAILAVNNAAVEHYGYSREEFLSMTIRDVQSPEESKRLEALFSSDLAEHYHAGVWKHCKKDGTIIDVDAYSHGVTLGGQNLRIGVLYDITESKRAGDALRESEQRFHTIFDSVNDAIIVQDLTTGVMLDVNQRMCELYGVTREDVLGSDIGVTASGIPPYTRQDALEWMRKAVEEGPQQFEWHTKDKAGKLFWIEVYLRRATIGGEERLLGTAQDITERKRTEEEKEFLREQLRQAQKMEAIGSLAGGVAHDFNNLLTVIKGYSHLSLSELREGDPMMENLKEVLAASNRASDLTRQLLAFGRRQMLEFKVMNLNKLIQGMEKMLRRIIGEDIDLMVYPKEGLGLIKTDPGQAEQVIFNLAVNARDAMPSGGKLILEVDNVYLDEEYARSHISMKPGYYVRLSVSDTGCGMTPEVTDRIFEPFFTTKEKGKGTGLGLSTVYGIVKQSGGNIWVYSEPGKGTTFKIYLPRVDEVVEELEEERVSEAIPRGNETVLVVEDEEAVRKLAVQILKRQGYKVLEAPQSGDALLVCEQHKEPIHLILTDVVMPRMSGPEFIDRLQQVRQDFKVLYMSGYTNEAVVHHGVREGEMAFMQKPFTLEGLSRKVREVLDKTPGLLLRLS